MRVAGGRLAGALAAVAAALLLLGAAGARAAELVYWDNLAAHTVGVLDLDGGAAGLLDTSGAEIVNPEGISYDPAGNRLYVASGSDHISYVNLDGGGGGILQPAPGTPAIFDPSGVAVDPVKRIAYWVNNPPMLPQSIAWLRLDGSEGGEFPRGGEPLAGAIRLTVDPASGRLYWANADGTIHFAPLIEHAGAAGTLEAGASASGTISGLAVDQAAGRIFWADPGADALYAAALGGAAKAPVDVAPAPVDEPVGIAFDPGRGRLYWANRGNGADPAGAIGFFDTGSNAGGGVTPDVPVESPQDPLVIKSPTSISPPPVTLSKGQLICGPGRWAEDWPSSSFYQSPRAYGYLWLLDEQPIAGATGQVLAPSVSGRYRCLVTASNQAGSTSVTSLGVQTSVTTTIRPGRTIIRPGSRPAELRLRGKARHLRARPGKLLTLKVRTANEGTVGSTAAKVCLKLTKGAKRALRAGKCRRLGPLEGGAAQVSKLRLRVKRSAEPGLYRLRISLPGDAVEVTVRVLG